MGYRVLYRKYRPDSFDSLVGQNHVVTILKNSVKENKLAHAYLFSGPRGTGKTSTARILAKSINCLNNISGLACNKCDNCLAFNGNPDIIEIDAASNNGVDEIRELINNVKIMPTSLKYKIYIIDEVHMLSQSAFNALLLTLEEPPEHVIFILATTNLESVPITIVSRCQKYEFKKISNTDILERLKYVCKEENIKYDDAGLKEIALLSDGGLRDALSILDQLSKDEEKITAELVNKEIGSISNKKIEDLLIALSKNDINSINKIFSDFESISINYKVLIKKMIYVVSETAIDALEGKSKISIDFDTCRKIVFELNDLINKININIDSYLMIKMVYLGYLNKNILIEKENIQSVLTVKNESDFEISASKCDTTANDKKTSTELSKEKSKKQQDSEFVDELVKVRINNCFVNASKAYLMEISKKWLEFVDKVSYSKIKGLIIDSNVVASSDEYAIIVTQIAHKELEINENINEIDKKFSKYIKKDFHVIFIDENRWKKEKEDYIINLKKKVKYSLIAEPIKDNNNRKDDIPDVSNVFDIDKIEIE